MTLTLWGWRVLILGAVVSTSTTTAAVNSTEECEASSMIPMDVAVTDEMRARYAAGP